MTIRTRVAPSPTGDPHVGSAYMSLMNYAFAKSQGGQFILRIEDTDQQRSTAASERMILDSLRWLGLTWDEGPDVGGPHGPYRQSERAAIYREHADLLLARGHAFKCFCSAERLDAMRAEQRAAGRSPGYDGCCARLTPAEIAAREAAGTPWVLRMRVPADGTCVIEDMLRGPIEIPWANVDMQVLMKSDGMPTYHLANVVDDHLMGITHVLRGEEWVSSAPKHQLLYAYFGWEMPKLCHLPLLRNPDKSKLSKRKNPTSILWYRDMGFLPQALLNYLGLFGTSSREGEEMFGLEEMVRRFAITNISLGGPVFDVDKLTWLNGRYLRETMDADGFLRAVQAWAGDPARLTAIARLAQTRVERLSDLGPLTAFLFSGRLDVPRERLRDVKLDEETQRKAYHVAMAVFDTLPEWTVATIEPALRGVADRLGVKFRDFVRPMYLAITGSPSSLPLFDGMEILGRDLVRTRLRDAVATLGGVSKSEEKAWAALALAGAPAGDAVSE